MTPRAQKPPKLTSLVKNPPNELPWPRMPRITPPWSKTPFKFPCNFHTPALRHVRSLLTDDVAQTVACRIVVSRLDYCNALLSGAPAATFDRLQRAQNNLARVGHCRVW